MKRKIILKNRERFFTFVILVAIFIVGTIVLLNIDNNAFGYSQPEYRFVYIDQGDTLWNIAQSNIKPGKDIREYIYEIKQINNLSSSELFVGQELLIPR